MTVPVRVTAPGKGQLKSWGVFFVNSAPMRDARLRVPGRFSPSEAKAFALRAAWRVYGRTLGETEGMQRRRDRPFWATRRTVAVSPEVPLLVDDQVLVPARWISVEILDLHTNEVLATMDAPESTTR